MSALGELRGPTADKGAGPGRLENKAGFAFLAPWLIDPLGCQADSVDGVRAVAVGIAGNVSLRTGAPVSIADLDLGVDLGVPRRGSVPTAV